MVYWEDDTKPETMGKVRVSANQNKVNISGLRGYTQYFLTVSAFNTAGTGPISPTINVTTRKTREYSVPTLTCCVFKASIGHFLVTVNKNSTVKKQLKSKQFSDL